MSPNEFENSKSHTLAKPPIHESLIIEPVVPIDKPTIPIVPHSLNLASKESEIQSCASPFKVYTRRKNPIMDLIHAQSLEQESSNTNPTLINSIDSDMLLPILLGKRKEHVCNIQLPILCLPVGRLPPSMLLCLNCSL